MIARAADFGKTPTTIVDSVELCRSTLHALIDQIADDVDVEIDLEDGAL